MSTPRDRVLLATVALLALFGCGTDGLQFTDDERVAWVTEDRATVELPVTLEWTTPGFEVTGPDGTSDPDAGYFAVFVDRSPQGRSQPLSNLAEDDETCLATAGCPDDEWYEQNGVYVVERGTSVTIDSLPVDDPDAETESHDFTLVLLDGQGRRLGESAERLRLEVRR